MRARYKELLYVTVTAGVVGVLGLAVYPYSRAAETDRTIKQAQEFAAKLNAQLKQDERFNGVYISETIEGSASLVVRGWVERQVELEALHREVDRAQPPVKIRWSVRAYDDAKGPGQSPM